MALDANIRGTSNLAEVALGGQLLVQPETNATDYPERIGGMKHYGANDEGDATGVVRLASPEVDVDFRQRVSQDLILDDHIFNYTAQDTGKHLSAAGTIASTWTVGNFTTNSGNTAAPAAGSFAGIATWAMFPNTGTQTLSADVTAAFSAQPTTNTFIEFGFAGASYVPSAAAPTDGVFARLDSAGLKLVAVNASTETVVAAPLANGTGVWAYTNDKKYQFIIYLGGVVAQLWVNDGTGAILLANIPMPAAQGRIASAQGMRFFFNQRVTTGAAGGAIQGKLGAYNVRLGGSNVTSTISTQGNRIFGSYQGASGGAMGTAARFGTITTGNEANVTAAVPTTTTAALGSGLGGTFWETVTLAVNTDGIIMSYQVPAATVSIPGRRLVLRGIYLNSYVQTVIVGGPYTAEWFLAFGHTAVSLATTEGAATKAPRRIALPFVQQVTAAQAVNTTVAQPQTFCDFGDAPIFINPGEFLQLCTRHIGTVGTSGTVVHRVTPVYGWE
jgi:hypothetical protein